MPTTCGTCESRLSHTLLIDSPCSASCTVPAGRTSRARGQLRHCHWCCGCDAALSVCGRGDSELFHKIDEERRFFESTPKTITFHQLLDVGLRSVENVAVQLRAFCVPAQPPTAACSTCFFALAEILTCRSPTMY